MKIIITAVLNSVAYQHKTQAESVILEPEFPKDNEEHKNAFGITDTIKIAATPGNLIKE